MPRKVELIAWFVLNTTMVIVAVPLSTEQMTLLVDDFFNGLLLLEQHLASSRLTLRGEVSVPIRNRQVPHGTSFS